MIKKNLMEVTVMLFKHPFLNLNIGLVKENFVIAKKLIKFFGKQEVSKKFVNIPYSDTSLILLKLLC